MAQAATFERGRLPEVFPLPRVRLAQVGGGSAQDQGSKALVGRMWSLLGV